MGKYEELDTLILNAIREASKPIAFFELGANKQIQDACRKIVGSEKDYWRAIDRRLQALRKAGKITYTGRGWVIA